MDLDFPELTIEQKAGLREHLALMEELSIHKEWRESQLSAEERMRCFPKEYVIFLKKEISRLRDCQYRLNQDMPLDSQRDFRQIFWDSYQKKIENHVRELKFMTLPAGQRKETDVSQLKQIPITNWIKFNRAGFAPCLWHAEKTGSMKYYKKSNKVYCFGCGHSDDIIGVIRQLKSCDFKTAVEILSTN